ncbi:MAG: ABC transporter substrate-binding protein [Desulfovibrionales bacterium]
MTRGNSGLCALVMLCVLVPVSVFCGENENARASEKSEIVIATVSSLASSLLYIAETRGYFKNNGINVILKEYATQRGATRALVHGEAHLATGMDSDVALAIMRQKDFLIYCSLARGTFFHVFTEQEHRIKKIADLKGKRIGIAETFTARHSLERFLNVHNLDLQEVRLRELSPGTELEVLEKERLDAVYAFNRYCHSRSSQQDAKPFTFNTPRRMDHFCLLIGRKETQPETGELPIKKLLDALLKAEEYMHRNSAEAKEILARRLDCPGDRLQALEQLILFTVSLDQTLLLSMEEFARWMKAREEQPGETPNFLRHIAVDPLATLKPDAMSIVR